MYRLLVVDDEANIRNVVREYAEFEEYEVTEAENGMEAVALCREQDFDLIIMDVMMPRLDGIRATLKIRENSSIPIIILSAKTEDSDKILGLNIGADDYITKPFNLKILRARIANLLANRALLREKYGSLNMAAEILEEPVGKNCLNALDWKFISGVRKNVEDNLDDPDFTVDSLCSLQNMSRSSFYNKLKALTGQAPADYIRLIRLNRAAELLKEGGKSVSEVAEMTGFCDGKYFREVFKKHFKVSPSRYGKEEPLRVDAE